MFPVVISLPLLALIFLVVSLTTGYFIYKEITGACNNPIFITGLALILFEFSTAGFIVILLTSVPWGSLIQVVP